MRTIIIHACSFVIIMITVINCTPKWDFGNDDPIPQIIIEGWIENGGFAFVSITRTKALNSKLDSADLADLSIRWAKVTVSDGSNTEILTGRMDQNYTPPFVYTGSQIRGEAGKTYTLTVEYSQRTVTAQTTIPAPVPLDKIEVEKCQDSDTLYQIRAFFRNDKSEKNYYKFFTRVKNNETRFYPSFMGTFDADVLADENATVSVFRGLRHGEVEHYTPFYKLNDTVIIKFTRIGKNEFDFWSSHENEVMNGNNPLVPSSSNLKSNVQGGYGIWAGYGAEQHVINIKDSILHSGK